ncbi:YhfG family protein [Thalassomonas sp. M1454]|uniref:YhfG family protein n=1 Tax=Thalassomonas sp. M1454 TaxID=2594477 RepID=UPI001180F4E4|nr:YhfG family protein [Thalassomonas sp. M1454]TRX57150.1 DUF2559 domain-containing protein [Thalassomonas sp. M1454]
MTTQEKRDKAFEAVKLKNYIDSLKLEGMSLVKDKTTLPKDVQEYIKQLKVSHG